MFPKLTDHSQFNLILTGETNLEIAEEKNSEEMAFLLSTTKSTTTTTFSYLISLYRVTPGWSRTTQRQPFGLVAGFVVVRPVGKRLNADNLC